MSKLQLIRERYLEVLRWHEKKTAPRLFITHENSSVDIGW